MFKSLALSLLLAFGATQAMAATLTLTASGTVDTAPAGIGAEVGDSFTLTAVVSEPAFSESSSSISSSALYRIETLSATIGPSTVAVTTPSNSAFLQVTSTLGSSVVSLSLNPGSFTQSADSFFLNLDVSWSFGPSIGTGVADLADLDFSTATQASFGAADSRISGPGISGTISAESFTLPAPPPSVIPLPAAGWLLLAGLGGLALLRRRARS